ncbi:hypothetical protein ACFORO_23595 [Amycolatopsis halotolerans]|uniref:DUF1453 domain-containing protein n=1 Tax=Amycolatopsis halotolerans TaxID=330083 RepID=A0ABV7QNK6_9PSEU
MPNTFDNILIGLVVLTWLMWRQLQVRRADRPPVVLLVISALGVASLGVAIAKTAPTTAAILLLVGSFVVAGGFGVARGYTMRIWRADGTLWRQGNWRTAVLWLISFGVHLGLDFAIDAANAAKGLGGASILLYLAVSLVTQRLTVRSRAHDALRKTSNAA